MSTREDFYSTLKKLEGLKYITVEASEDKGTYSISWDLNLDELAKIDGHTPCAWARLLYSELDAEDAFYLGAHEGDNVDNAISVLNFIAFGEEDVENIIAFAKEHIDQERWSWYEEE